MQSKDRSALCLLHFRYISTPSKAYLRSAETPSLTGFCVSGIKTSLRFSFIQPTLLLCQIWIEGLKQSSKDIPNL